MESPRIFADAQKSRLTMNEYLSSLNEYVKPIVADIPALEQKLVKATQAKGGLRKLVRSVINVEK